MNNLRTVYSTDPKEKVTCNKCKKNLTECRCVKEESVNKSQFVAVLRIEKNGRGGKSVTIIDKLPKNESFLKELTKQLKSKCATGGTYRLSSSESLIEIQGEKVDVVKKILQMNEIKYKGL
ncbi:MAG: hypothetical protein L6Q37_08550 [Bdellovibrionaceae bacterium]|nr:hypothetical protein [Pseudobdellovibrionaceae bacterium]NUM60184.1 stress response translation initiation inhibitor YciH [Pseudobdellovibrionaceae bacterium]